MYGYCIVHYYYTVSLCIFMYTAVSCGDAPPAPKNGIYIVSSTTFGSTVSYVCNQGYSLSPMGPNKVTCTANETWDGSVPECNSKLLHNCNSY